MIKPALETIGEPYFGIHALFPNPSKGSTNLHFLVPNNESVDIQLLDLMGRTLAQHRIRATAGQNTFMLHALPLRKGIHLVRILRTNGEYDIRKLIIQ